MSIDVSLMRNKDGRSMRNRGNVVVKTPDILKASFHLTDASTSSQRSSAVTISDTESQKDNSSMVSSIRDNISDRGNESSDDSLDVQIDPKERARLKLFRNRRSALDELLTTERGYIEDLAQIVQGYMELMKKDDIPKPGTLIGKELMVFGNLQQIYEWHKNTFEPEMEKYIDVPQKLGSIFTRFEKRFYMYVKYCENKPKSEDITYENLDYFEQLREILDHKLQLADMLIKPVQRIMKYELLLKAIMKYTEKAGEDVKEIQRAIEVMGIIPRAANDMMNVGRLQGFDVWNVFFLLLILNAFELTPETAASFQPLPSFPNLQGKVTAQGRLLLQDTMEVSEQSSKNTLERISFRERKAFLFEQIIIFSKTVDRRKQTTNTGLHYMYCGSIRVNKMILTEMPNNPLDFRIVDKSPGAPVQYLCQCKTENMKRNWVTQIKILLDNQRDFLKALQSPISYVKECIRIESGDAAASVEVPPTESPSEKAPKTVKKSKSNRSIKNLFIKSIHENAHPKVDCSPSTSNSRKFSLPFFEAFAKTPEVETKSRWSRLTTFTRSKNSMSPQSPDNRNLLLVSENANKKHLSVSNENIWAEKFSDSEKEDVARVMVERIEPKTAGNVPMRNPMLFMETTKKSRETKEVPLTFTKELEDVSVTEGSAVTLSCHLSANSFAHSISWMGPNDENLVGKDDVTMESGHGVLSLKMFRVLPSHSGMYKCKVRSNKETLVSSCYLKVLPEILPKPRRKTTLTDLESSSVKGDTSPCTSPRTKSSESFSWSKGFESKYELQKVIERGKFSVFYVCLEKSSKLKFSAKSYPRMVKTKDSVYREALLSGSTSHPCIMQAQKILETNDSFIILFPFFPHRSRLFDYISNLYSFDEWQAIDFGQQLFSGLSHLHERSILHLTIKPENFDVDLTLPSSPTLKLMDFSEARSYESSLPHVHHFAGDSEFTPPEVFHNFPLTLCSDVWNGAIILYTMLSGTTPFHGKDADSTRKNIVSLLYDFPKPAFSDIHPSVISLISSVLVMPPSQRPSARHCSEACSHLKTVSKRIRIDKSLFVDFVKRRLNMQM